jgi:3-deoxy-manno-octulosonate cytidylyltransferase (CMP-KDO synthetase)
MIQHVYLRVPVRVKAAAVYVATDDERIAAAVSGFGGEVMLTRVRSCSQGTDSIQEVAVQLGLSETAIVVNVQGDEPLIPPETINQVAANLQKIF